jgi:hypothetical protein
MKELIRRILREQVDIQSNISICKENQTVNEYLKTFTLWRTAICNQDTFKTPEERAKLISQNFKGKDKITLDDGTEITKVNYEQKLSNDYDERIEMCYSQYQGERIGLNDVCNEIIINEYSNDILRRYFNRYMKYPDRCNAFIEDTCTEPKPLQSKGFQLLQIQVKGLELKKTAPVLPQVPQSQKNTNIIDKVKDVAGSTMYNLRKKFGR